MTTILQLSDPHLMSDPQGRLKNVPTYESLKQVIQFARTSCSNPDHVVISGDLSHEHTVAGYELLRDLLGDWVERALVIPGNHDDRGGMRQVFSQVPGRSDEEVWFQQVIGDWQLIGLDSHVPGQVYGELSNTMLTQLNSWLANSDRPTVIFLHHPPASVMSHWIDQIGLQNPVPLADVLHQHAHVKGLFCGHIHQVFQGEFAGVEFSSAPSTAFQFKPGTVKMQLDELPAGFRIIELQERVASQVVRLDELSFTPSNDSAR